MKKPEFVYSHRWRVSGLLACDDAATQDLAVIDHREKRGGIARDALNSVNI